MSITAQPVWKFLANLGDANPIDYGGLFVFIDETQHYPPEAVRLIVEEVDGEAQRWFFYRFILEDLKLVEHDGRTLIISARYDSSWPHPIEEYDEWFASDLNAVAAHVGVSLQEMRDGLTSVDPRTRATAWEAIGDFHGFVNLDNYPDTYASAEEVEKRLLSLGVTL